MATPSLPNTFTEAEAARLIRISRITLLRARKRGEIAFFRIGRRVVYSDRHIREFLQRSERSPFEVSDSTEARKPPAARRGPVE